MIVDSENRILVRSIPFSEITVGELGLCVPNQILFIDSAHQRVCIYRKSE